MTGGVIVGSRLRSYHTLLLYRGTWDHVPGIPLYQQVGHLQPWCVGCSQGCEFQQRWDYDYPVMGSMIWFSQLGDHSFYDLPAMGAYYGCLGLEAYSHTLQLPGPRVLQLLGTARAESPISLSWAWCTPVAAGDTLLDMQI